MTVWLASVGTTQTSMIVPSTKLAPALGVNLMDVIAATFSHRLDSTLTIAEYERFVEERRSKLFSRIQDALKTR